MLLLVLSALDLGIGAVIVFGLCLGVVWTGVAVILYRSYTRALADEVRRSPLPLVDLEAEESAEVRALLMSEDARDIRLGLDLLAGASSSVLETELRRIAAHSSPEVRVRALGALAESGDARASAEADGARRRASRARTIPRIDGPPQPRSPGAARRRRTGRCSPASSTIQTSRYALPLSMRSHRTTPIDAEIVHRVVAAVRVARLGGRATAAVGRLGEAAVAPLGAEVARGDVPRPASLVRAAAAMTPDHGIWIVQPALDDARPRRRARCARLARCGTLWRTSRRRACWSSYSSMPQRLAERADAARAALADYDASLVRALDDEIDLARRLVIAVLALRHGEGIRAAVRVIDCEEGQRRALAIEALDVVLSRREAAIALPLVTRDLTAKERAADSRRTGWPAHQPEEWIADIAGDPEGIWRSPWLTACALHATDHRGRHSAYGA